MTSHITSIISEINSKDKTKWGLHNKVKAKTQTLLTLRIFCSIIYLSKNGRETHDNTGQCRLDMLVPIRHKFLDTRQQLKIISNLLINQLINNRPVSWRHAPAHFYQDSDRNPSLCGRLLLVPNYFKIINY